MKIACIYWYTSSVGGIATHLNSLRLAAIQAGDQFDILHSRAWKTKQPKVFEARQWIRGGDTRIWIDGEVPSGEGNAASSARWLEKNYDAILFGFICPHQTKAYPRPEFLPIYDCRLPKAALLTDGYWDSYSHWATPLLPKLNGVLAVVESYLFPLRKMGYVKGSVSGVPFVPQKGMSARRSNQPLLVWPNQWKNIKGITQFLEEIPRLPKELIVELYSNGIRYYQLRESDVWRSAVGKDLFGGYSGEGRATFFGNLDLPEIIKAYQRAWFTVNLQGMTTRKETYRRGSYNYTEVESLWYGACPILHQSAQQTILPRDCYISVKSATEIPGCINSAISSGIALDPARQKRAREFVIDRHLASKRYQEVRKLLV